MNTFTLILKSLLMWFGFVILAIANGSFREFFITPYLGEQSGHIISTITFISIIFLVTFIFVKIINKKRLITSKTFLIIGLSWTILTIAFEFIFGHFVMHHPWEKLLADYNLLQGRVWIFVLIATATAPWFWASKMKNRSTN